MNDLEIIISPELWEKGPNNPTNGGENGGPKWGNGTKNNETVEEKLSKISLKLNVPIGKFRQLQGLWIS